MYRWSGTASGICLGSQWLWVHVLPGTQLFEAPQSMYLTGYGPMSCSTEQPCDIAAFSCAFHPQVELWRKPIHGGQARELPSMPLPEPLREQHHSTLPSRIRKEGGSILSMLVSVQVAKGVPKAFHKRRWTMGSSMCRCTKACTYAHQEGPSKGLCWQDHEGIQHLMLVVLLACTECA